MSAASQSQQFGVSVDSNNEFVETGITEEKSALPFFHPAMMAFEMHARHYGYNKPAYAELHSNSNKFALYRPSVPYKHVWCGTCDATGALNAAVMLDADEVPDHVPVCPKCKGKGYHHRDQMDIHTAAICKKRLDDLMYSLVLRAAMREADVLTGRLDNIMSATQITMVGGMPYQVTTVQPTAAAMQDAIERIFPAFDPESTEYIPGGMPSYVCGLAQHGDDDAYIYVIPATSPGEAEIILEHAKQKLTVINDELIGIFETVDMAGLRFGAKYRLPAPRFSDIPMRSLVAFRYQVLNELVPGSLVVYGEDAFNLAYYAAATGKWLTPRILEREGYIPLVHDFNSCFINPKVEYGPVALTLLKMGWRELESHNDVVILTPNNEQIVMGAWIVPIIEQYGQDGWIVLGSPNWNDNDDIPF